MPAKYEQLRPQRPKRLSDQPSLTRELLFALLDGRAQIVGFDWSQTGMSWATVRIEPTTPRPCRRCSTELADRSNGPWCGPCFQLEIRRIFVRETSAPREGSD